MSKYLKILYNITVMIILGILIPFIGTVLGASLVFLMRKSIKENVQQVLNGFASGVMVAASIWSLLIPSIEQSESLGKLSFLPAVIGFLLGMLFLLLLDKIIPHLHLDGCEAEGIDCKLKDTTKMLFAVTLHNVPEGMAVGVVFAGVVAGSSSLTILGAIALAIGIAVQNFPEGAIVSLPLMANGFSKPKAFISGVLSGVVEPLFAGLTILFSNVIIPILPYLLSFSAGSMMYVVIEELVPEMATKKHSDVGVIAFAVGFSLMMILDVALG